MNTGTRAEPRTAADTLVDAGLLSLCRSALDSYPGGLLIIDASDRPIMVGPRSDSLTAALDRAAAEEARHASGASGMAPAPADGLPVAMPGPVRALAERARGDGAAVEEIVSLPGETGPTWFRLSLLPLECLEPDCEPGRLLVLARDVTLERTLRAALVDSRQRYKDFVEISTDFAWETGRDGAFVFVSPRGALGYPAQRLVATDPASLVAEYFGPGSIPFHAREPVEDVDVWLRAATGALACVRMSATPLYNAHGEWSGARGVGRDVTRERDRDAALARARNRERILAYITRAIRDEVNPTDMLATAAETLGRGLGATVCQVFRVPETDDAERPTAGPGEGATAATADNGEGPPLTFVPGARWGDLGYMAAGPVLDRLRQRRGRLEVEIGDWSIMAAPTVYRHALNGAVVLWREAGRGPWSEDDRLLIGEIASQLGIALEQIANHESILRMSRTDPLTGLFNRRAFFGELERRHRRLERDRSPASLIYLDLDNFKVINDRSGHQAGDDLLLRLRDVLVGNTRPTDLVARLGGDEFAVWLEGADTSVAQAKAEILVTAARALDEAAIGGDKPLSLSLGLAVHEAGSGETLAEMLARADAAMYAAKHTGKNAWRLAPPPGGRGGPAPDSRGMEVKA
ncbi:diguanylate cyclase domain-containing protein [Caenispirillum salinarum]|uniref:sensor domain-containing diguanylate cyclase n=1 Tax=Caenispirillum salinarum TaxID=859058 RepID=UPI00384EF233